jgi:outer membrane lipoprotein-sorting protein
MIEIVLSVIILFGAGYVNAQDAAEIIRKADDKWNGEQSSESQMTMTIIRPDWERTIGFKNWTKGKDMAMTLITEPARERGQAFLKRDKDMWNWMPTIERMIKLPPAMLSDGWMGSDYTNDDILNESSMIRDYNHQIVKTETIDGHSCWIIELIPHEDAPVVWGKILKWITKDEYIQLKSEYYDEDDFLIKTELASDLKTMDGRLIPTRIEIIPADKANQKTVVILNSIRFNTEINESFFSQQNMRRLR